MEEVQPNFDVYMLGKLLWWMVSGRVKLPREYYLRPDFNLTQTYPGDPGMHLVNSVLEHCVVEDPTKCLKSARELLEIVDQMLAILGRGGQLMSDDVPRPCRICGIGSYTPQTNQLTGLTRYDLVTRPLGAIYADFYICDNCGHLELFKTKKRTP